MLHGFNLYGFPGAPKFQLKTCRVYTITSREPFAGAVCQCDWTYVARFLAHKDPERDARMRAEVEDLAASVGATVAEIEVSESKAQLWGLGFIL
jgi:hypothetical protein